MFMGRNPLVPLGALLTAGVLVRGVTAMYQGDKVMSQKMMRARIGMQGLTVVTVRAPQKTPLPPPSCHPKMAML
jgi:hypothetical protein